MSAVQYRTAIAAIPVIRAAAGERRLLTYKQLARELGRDPTRDSRMIAQVCDLLDASAAYAGVPLAALVMVRNAEGRINPMAWKANTPDGVREAIIDRSLAHRFTEDDFNLIERGLRALEGRGNHKAWEKVRELIPLEALYSNLSAPFRDAVDDLGTDDPAQDLYTGKRYGRDPRVRSEVERRANGRCEHCGDRGFLRADGSFYVETHHVIALANDGADRMSNVIGLCANHHRQAHFGEDRAALEQSFLKTLSRLA